MKFKDMDLETCELSNVLSPSWFSLFTLIILPEVRFEEVSMKS